MHGHSQVPPSFMLDAVNDVEALAAGTGPRLPVVTAVTEMSTANGNPSHQHQQQHARMANGSVLDRHSSLPVASLVAASPSSPHNSSAALATDNAKTPLMNRRCWRIVPLVMGLLVVSIFVAVTLGLLFLRPLLESSATTANKPVPGLPQQQSQPPLAAPMDGVVVAAPTSLFISPPVEAPAIPPVASKLPTRAPKRTSSAPQKSANAPLSLAPITNLTTFDPTSFSPVATTLPVASTPAFGPSSSFTAPREAVLINCGATQNVTDDNERIWMSDRYFGNNSMITTSTAPILNETNFDGLYQTHRTSLDWQNLTYSIPVPEGEYNIVMHFVEAVFSQTDSRVFTITLEAQQVVEIGKIDILLLAGGQNRVLTRTVFDVLVVDGTLDITLVRLIENPTVAAIEVIWSKEHLAHAVTGGPYFAVDADGDGFENVAVLAIESHTHGPVNRLVSYTWTSATGDENLGTGMEALLLLPVGNTTVRLTVVDNTGSVDSDETVIRVVPLGYPVVFEVSPLTGPPVGGTLVIIKGQAIGTATAVRFGPVLLTAGNFTVVDSDTITIETPKSGADGAVMVSVITLLGESNATRFTYVDDSGLVRFAENRLMLIDVPTAIAFGPDGNLYVGTQSGTLARVTLSEEYDLVVRVVSTSMGSDRSILGIAFDPVETPELGDSISVYISTCQLFHSESNSSTGLSINGKVQQIRGADLTSTVDIVTGLPVSRYDHGVNGLYFGDNGELYICVGGNTNAGHPNSMTGYAIEGYLSAAILVANLGQPDFSAYITYDAPHNGSPIAGFGPNGVEVFASGLRNSYGVTMTSSGKLYATDNGSNKVQGKSSTGCGEGQWVNGVDENDKLLLLQKGGYYGHANRKRGESDPRQCVWQSSNATSTANFTAPILRLPSSTNGIIEFESDHFDGAMRGNLIVSKYQEALYRIILSPDGQSVDPFTNPPIVLDGDGSLTVTQAPDGSLMDARHVQDSVFHYVPVETASSTMDIKAVFPRRGHLSGNSKLMIFGVNFSGSPTVTVGGNACAGAVLVSSKKIECTLPAGAVGRKDVVVTIGATSDTYVNGYRYITGVPL